MQLSRGETLATSSGIIIIIQKETITSLNMKGGHGVTSDKLSAFCLFNESPNPHVPTNTLTFKASSVSDDKHTHKDVIYKSFGLESRTAWK